MRKLKSNSTIQSTFLGISYFFKKHFTTMSYDSRNHNLGILYPVRDVPMFYHTALIVINSILTQRKSVVSINDSQHAPCHVAYFGGFTVLG